MNKTTIKSFAIRARQQLLEGVRQRACGVDLQTLAEEIRSRGYERIPPSAIGRSRVWSPRIRCPSTPRASLRMF